MIDTDAFHLSQPGTFTDLMTEVLRSGARGFLAEAAATEVSAGFGGHPEKLTEHGCQ
jgi:putative transposase